MVRWHCFHSVELQETVFMSLFNRHFRVTCVSDSIPAPGGKLDLPFLELIFFGFDKRLHVEFSQHPNVPMTGSFCSVGRFSLILGPGWVVGITSWCLAFFLTFALFLLNHIQRLDEFTISSKSPCTVRPSQCYKVI